MFPDIYDDDQRRISDFCCADNANVVTVSRCAGHTPPYSSKNAADSFYQNPCNLQLYWILVWVYFAIKQKAWKEKETGKLRETINTCYFHCLHKASSLYRYIQAYIYANNNKDQSNLAKGVIIHSFIYSFIHDAKGSATSQVAKKPKVNNVGHPNTHY